MQLSVDVSYTVDASAIRLPFRIVDNKKFGWNFTTSPVMCPILGKVCSPSVWTSDGQFQYSSRDFTFTQCQFIIRRFIFIQIYPFNFYYFISKYYFISYQSVQESF